MENFEHTPSARGQVFLWGGIAAGLVLLLALYTRGFGLFARHAGAPETPLLEHRGAQIFIPESSPLRQRLTVVPAAEESVSGNVRAPGQVESDPARTALLLSPVAGRVKEVKVSPGSRVSAGQALAIIDSPDLAQAYDDDVKAAEMLRLNAKNLERQEGQYQIGAVAERDLDQARSDHAQAASEYARTQAHLRAIGVPADAKQRSSLFTVRAPFDGSVTAVSIATGNMLNDPTQPILTVADLGTVWVTALVAEKDLPGVAKGQEAQVTLEAYPSETLKGTVLSVSDVVEADSHRNKVRIAFPNAHYLLKPNMFTTVTLFGPPHARVVLPTSALLMNNDRTSVFVATAPWTFERRLVEPLLQEGTRVPIRAGISPGDQVVIKGGILLND
jgi:cobalt-zinc-cadmium efflux system membrane fusion protein